MKINRYSRVRFAGQSLLWSLLLYTAIVLAMDWEDFKRRLNNEPYVVKVIPATIHKTDKRISTYTVSAIKAIWLHITRSHS
jgi:hypothetical protein